jgi:hypothetical protein
MVNFSPPHRPRYRSKRNFKLTDAMIADIWARLRAGAEYQHEIAARHGINQGRVSEIKTAGSGATTLPVCPRAKR